MNVALTKKLRYYEYVVTARGESTDLMWGFDTIRRLNNTQTPSRTVLPDEAYVEPRALWWAFDRDSARRRGKSGRLEEASGQRTPAMWRGRTRSF